MFILKLAGKILLLPVWLILFVIGLAVKMTVQTYAVVRGILGFLFTLLIIATAYCYHDWVQVAFLFVLSTILYLILFAGVVVDTVLDMTRESIIDFIYLEEDMKMSEKNDFIQLPPIKKDTPSEVVSIIWQYLKLPEESRKRVTANLIDVDENCEKKDFQVPDLYDIVPKEEIAEFEDIMRKIMTGIISEASGIATWVYVQKYEKHKTLDEMLQEWKGASQFIIVMDTWFERLMAE